MGVCRICQGGANYFCLGACHAWRSHAFARGVRGMLDRKIFFEWCNLVRFEAYFHKFFTFKKSKNIIFLLYWGPFCYFSSYIGAFLLRFSHFLGAFSPWGVFLLHGGGLFFGLAPAPYENFCGRPWLQGRFESMLRGNFFVWLQFSEFWTCFVTTLPEKWQK